MKKIIVQKNFLNITRFRRATKTW